MRIGVYTLDLRNCQTLEGNILLAGAVSLYYFVCDLLQATRPQRFDPLVEALSPAYSAPLFSLSASGSSFAYWLCLHKVIKVASQPVGIAPRVSLLGLSQVTYITLYGYALIRSFVVIRKSSNLKKRLAEFNLNEYFRDADRVSKYATAMFAYNSSVVLQAICTTIDSLTYVKVGALLAASAAVNLVSLYYAKRYAHDLLHRT